VALISMIYRSRWSLSREATEQYAAVSGTIPVTLSDDGGFLDGFLMDQDKRQIIYDSVDELKKDIKKLLSVLNTGRAVKSYLKTV